MLDRPHILIIDNNTELCERIQEVLSRLGVESVIAPNGRVAMTLLAEKHFDLILLEIMLPDINFSEIINYIHGSEVDSLVVLMSKNIPKETIRHCLQKNVYGLLQKPFELTQLLPIVQIALHRKIDYQLRRKHSRWGTANSGSHRDRRHLWKDRRLVKDPWYSGPERRSGKDRRTRKVKIPPSTVANSLLDPAADQTIVKRTYARLFEKFFPRRTSLVQEKRQHARVNVGWLLTIKGFPGTMRGRMKNVSTGGAFICAVNFLKPGEIFSVKIHRGFVSDRHMALLAKAVRSGVHCVDDIEYPYGVAVEFLRVSDDDREMLRKFISAQLKGVATGSGLGYVEEAREGEDDMTEEKGSMELIANPSFYPSVKVMWTEAGAQEICEATAPFNKEVWLTLATECRDRAAAIDASQKMISCLNLMADLIMSEINAEEKRERNREAYDSFADFITEINARTDLDKTRKAQMIHDRAYQLKMD
jgi:CheY-like chemotaxis protein